MKKKQLAVAVMLATTMTFSAIALTACEKPDEQTGPTVEQVQTTLKEGVYKQKMDKYEFVMKFYDDENVYFQNENTGFRCKYKIEQAPITYVACKDDGSNYAHYEKDKGTPDNPADKDADKAKWITGNFIIAFYKDDLTTPIDYKMNSPETGEHLEEIYPKLCYKYETPSHYLAYDPETDTIRSFAGNYGSRTLAHDKEKAFTVNDEKEIYEARYMVKTLPADAKPGETESDFHFSLSQKGYTSTIPALKALGIQAGDFVKTETGYDFTDTVSSKTSKLVITEADGKTTYKIQQDGQDVLELVPYKLIKKFAVELTGKLNDRIPVALRLNEDGTVTKDEELQGKYKADKETGEITFTAEQGSMITELALTFTTDKATQKTTVSGTVKASAQGNEMTGALTGEVKGKLYGLEGAALLSLESKEDAEGGEKVKLEFKDNLTLALSIGGEQKASGYWRLDTSSQTPKMAFYGVSSGEFEFALAAKGNFKWTGKLSSTDENGKEYNFEFETADLAKLMNASAVQKHKISAQLQHDKLGNPTLDLVFYNNGMVAIENVKNDGEKDVTTVMATGTWKLVLPGAGSPMPSIAIDKWDNGTIVPGSGEGGTYEFKWSGGAISVFKDLGLTFSMSSSDFGKFQ